MESVGLAGPATRTPADNSGAGRETSEDVLLSALGAGEPSDDGMRDGAEADASENTPRQDLSNPSDESDDHQGSGPADGEEPDDKRKKRDRVQERIDQLTARAKTAEEEREALQADLDKLKAKLEAADHDKPEKEGAGGDGMDPIASDPVFAKFSQTVAKARSEADAARALRRRLRAYPEQTLEQLKAKGVDLPDADAAGDWLEDYESSRRDEIADARAGMAKRQAVLEGENAHASEAWAAAAQQRYAWLAEKDDPRHALMANAAQRFPWVRKFPAGMAALAALADMAHHAKLTRDGAPANGKPASAASAAPERASTVRPGAGGGGAPASRPGSAADSKSARAAELQRRLDQNPDDDEALVELLDGLPRS